VVDADLEEVLVVVEVVPQVEVEAGPWEGAVVVVVVVEHEEVEEVNSHHPIDLGQHSTGPHCLYHQFGLQL